MSGGEDLEHSCLGTGSIMSALLTKTIGEGWWSVFSCVYQCGFGKSPLLAACGFGVPVTVMQQFVSAGRVVVTNDGDGRVEGVCCGLIDQPVHPSLNWAPASAVSLF